jgi:subtilisin family serine protease
MNEGSMARYDLHGSVWKGRHEGHPDVLQGPGYLYRPGHILVAADQEYTAGAVAHLQGLGATPHEEFTARFSQEGLPVHAYNVSAEHHVPTLVDRLREHEHGKPTPNVGPNHVFSGEYVYEGGPQGGPHATKEGDESRVPHPNAGPARIAILDTGYDHAVKIFHPQLAERLEPVGEEDPLLRGDLLAHEAGHGTFIAGIIMKHSPELHIRQVRVLDPAGMGDDVTVALGLLRVSSASVINLSLGGYTHGGRPPVALGAALDQLHDSVAVVAAAGNAGSQDPFWPAAFPRVVAVGALDTTNGEPALAHFSNYGYWVDVYAPGTDVHSTYLHGVYEEPDAHLEHLKGWARWSGTSFAAPQVAAEIASRSGDGTTAREAAVQLVASAKQLPGIGAVLIPGEDHAWS